MNKDAYANVAEIIIKGTKKEEKTKRKQRI